jgi:hypothetical protein
MSLGSTAVTDLIAEIALLRQYIAERPHNGELLWADYQKLAELERQRADDAEMNYNVLVEEFSHELRWAERRTREALRKLKSAKDLAATALEMLWSLQWSGSEAIGMFALDDNGYRGYLIAVCPVCHAEGSGSPGWSSLHGSAPAHRKDCRLGDLLGRPEVRAVRERI